jgi:enediyne biosynthesis protein E4
MKKIVFICFSFCFFSCGKNTPKNEIFKALDAKDTGVDFSNDLKPSGDLNIFNYMYFYNGGGVATADLNNDGKQDLIFTSNQNQNKIYLNKGGLKFEDVSEAANFKNEKGWSTGVSVVDINQDGLLDIYINRVGKFEMLSGHNLLFICDNIDKKGVPHYTESSAEYGLNLVGFGTQTAFFDADLDGDLDMFQLNHSVHQNGTYGRREVFLNTFHELAGDRFFENIDGKYIETTQKVGIHSSAIGYGLGIALSDVNLDGYPDFYIGNDFHENDYLYINQKNGSFKDEMLDKIDHTSRFSMGVDMADLNNDIFPEIFTLDMLPYEPEILKRSEGEDAFYNFKFKLSQGYNIQFARNNLQFNNKNGYFSEIGMYAGVYATDWSWSTLLFDFENDGKKDIFISNGINKRMNDLDYINFVSSDEIQEKISKKKFDESDESLVDLLPEIKIPNKFYSNAGEVKFNDLSEQVSGNVGSFSNGSIYVDLDNDGDLDVVTNNINQKAFVYENLSNVYATENKHLTVKLAGAAKNKNAIGSKVIVYADSNTFFQEKFPVRGFQSSIEAPLTFGIGKVQKIDSVLIIWPDNSFQVVKNVKPNSVLELKYQSNLPIFDYQVFHKIKNEFVDIASEIGLDFIHEENAFNEFDREALIPNMMSTEGPALTVGDINNDGLEDVFVGSSKWKKSKIFVQNANGKFSESLQISLVADSTFEDVDAVFADINGDGYKDLVVASGGNEFYGKSPNLVPRLYLNDKKGSFIKKADAFKDLFLTASVVLAKDINNDKKVDLFIGARAVSWAYGEIPSSYFLINDGYGNFSDQTDKLAPELKKSGFVKNAVWVDYDSDKEEELVIAYEWDGIKAFKKESKKYKETYLTDKKGWWNFVMPMDVNQDGKLDFVCGNLGQNSRLHASEKEPIRMYVNDIDENGRLDHIITLYMQGKETIFADKREIEKQLPFVKKKYIFSKDFATASLKDIFGSDKISDAKVFEANYFDNSVLINKGDGTFKLESMAGPVQWTPYYAAVDISAYRKSEFMMLGNFYECNIQMGLYDADQGNIYKYLSDGKTQKSPIRQAPLKGQTRRIKPIVVNGKTIYLVANNNAKMMALSHHSNLKL